MKKNVFDAVNALMFVTMGPVTSGMIRKGFLMTYRQVKRFRLLLHRQL
jgi:hypothetical protein